VTVQRVRFQGPTELAMLRGARVEYAAWKDTHHDSGAGGVQAFLKIMRGMQEAARPGRNHFFPLSAGLTPAG
jgi:hypothetical protein